MFGLGAAGASVVAAAADDDTANTSPKAPNLPKNNNYSISLLEKSNIKKFSGLGRRRRIYQNTHYTKSVLKPPHP